MTTSMKAAVFRGPGRFEVTEIDRPVCGPNDVVLKVKACGICGSDLHGWRESIFAHDGMIMGHEFVGEVVEVGAEVQGISVGDRAFGGSGSLCGECFWCKRGEYRLCPELFPRAYALPGAFAEYKHVANARSGLNLHRFAPDVDDMEAVLAEPLGVAILAVSKANLQPTDKVVVLGAGVIGNLILQVAKQQAAQVVVVDVSEKRLEAALAVGADAVINARTENVMERVKELVGEGRYHFGVGAMADAVIETAGVPETVAQTLEMVRSGGTVVYVGLAERLAPININRVVHKDPRLVGSFGGDYAAAVQMINEHRIQATPLVSHRFPLERINDAFAVQNMAHESIKVVVMP